MKIKPKMSERGAQALLERGINVAEAVRRGVTSAVSQTRGDDREWLAFPHRITPEGPTHWQFRTITGEKEFKSSTGTSQHRTFFNAEALLDPDLADQLPIITEGQLDALSFMSSGFLRVVSVPDGASRQDEPGRDARKNKYRYLSHFLPALNECPVVILAVDDDDPGRGLMRDLMSRIGPERCKWVSYGGLKDANDLLVEAGPSALVQAVDAAKWVQLDGFYENIDDIPALPRSEVMRLGVDGLDDLWRIERGRLTILVGIPAHGKTALINFAMTRLVNQYPAVVCFASFEQYPNPEHRNNLRRCFLGGDPNSAPQSDLDRADRWIRENFVFIVPSRDEPPTFTWLLERARMAVLRANTSVLVIDPWNELAHEDRPADIPMTEYISVMLRKLRRFAQEYHVSVIVAVHPAKMPRQTDGKSPIPVGYDCADSASWVNRADIGLSIYRKDKDATLIRNWKTRHQPDLGEPGDRVFSFLRSSNSYIHRPDIEGMK